MNLRHYLWVCERTPCDKRINQHRFKYLFWNIQSAHLSIIWPKEVTFWSVTLWLVWLCTWIPQQRTQIRVGPVLCRTRFCPTRPDPSPSLTRPEPNRPVPSRNLLGHCNIFWKWHGNAAGGAVYAGENFLTNLQHQQLITETQSPRDAVFWASNKEAEIARINILVN